MGPPGGFSNAEGGLTSRLVRLRGRSSVSALRDSCKGDHVAYRRAIRARRCRFANRARCWRQHWHIVGSVQQVTCVVTDISTAPAEQSIGFEQVNTAVNQMAEILRQNAALVEEAAAALQSMAEQAASFRVAVFKIEAPAETDVGYNYVRDFFGQ